MKYSVRHEKIRTNLTTTNFDSEGCIRQAVLLECTIGLVSNSSLEESNNHKW